MSVVVFAHEMGHYLVARANGIRVDEFSVGMGKVIFSWKDRGNTIWNICLIPCGGSCKFLGDEDIASLVADRKKIEKLSAKEKDMCLQYKSPWKKIQVAIAGPLANYILAIVLLTGIFRLYGFNKLSNVVGNVNPGSSAEIAGIMAGDAIVSIDGRKTKDFKNVQRAILSSKGPMRIELNRNGETLEKTVVPNIVTKNVFFMRTVKIPQLGIVSLTDTRREKVGFYEAFLHSLEHVGEITVANVQFLRGKHGFKDIGGPIKIAKYSGMALEGGFYIFIVFIAFISANLGFMNLLPIPVLDGGHILLYLVEIIRRKPISEKSENNINKICFSILLTLMIFFTIRDILTWKL
jgi:regulator of sigma E protease